MPRRKFLKQLIASKISLKHSVSSVCSQMSFPAAISLWTLKTLQKQCMGFFMSLRCYTSSFYDYSYIIASTVGRKLRGSGTKLAASISVHFYYFI